MFSADLRPVSLIRSIWEPRARIWAFPHERWLSNVVRSFLTPYLSILPPNASIIDIAAGANNEDFYPEGFDHGKVTAVDVSRTALELNQSGIKLNHDVRFPLTPLHLAPFDFGVCCFGFRYFENQTQVVVHILEILKPGARFAVVDFVDYEHDDMVRKFEIKTLKAELINHPEIKLIEAVNIKPERFDHCKIDGIIFQKTG